MINLDLLTDRERDILRLSAIDKTAGEIADELFISPYTVQTHRANVLKNPAAITCRADLFLEIPFAGIGFTLGYREINPAFSLCQALIISKITTYFRKKFFVIFLRFGSSHICILPSR